MFTSVFAFVFSTDLLSATDYLGIGDLLNWGGMIGDFDYPCRVLYLLIEGDLVFDLFLAPYTDLLY